MQAATVEILLHGETGAKEADACQTRCADARRGGVGQMQQGNIDGCFDLRRDPMHGVRADEEEVGARGFDLPRPCSEQIARFGPGVRALQLLDGLKIDAHKGDRCAVQTPAQAPRLLIDQAIVERCAFPAHAAEHADRLHGVALSRIARAGCDLGQHQLTVISALYARAAWCRPRRRIEGRRRAARRFPGARARR